MKGGDHVMKYKKDKNYIIQVRVTEADLLLIDEMAEKEKRTRSEMLRSFINKGVNDGKEAEKIAI